MSKDNKQQDKPGKIYEKRDRENGGFVYDKSINNEDRHRVTDTAPPPRRRPTDGSNKK